MSFIIELWLPILLSAVFVFIASAMIHLVFHGWHANDYLRSDEAERTLMSTLSNLALAPGEYMLPYSTSRKGMKWPSAGMDMEFAGEWRITRLAPNHFTSSLLVKWFIASLAVSVICAYVAQFALAADADYLLIFRLTSVVAFCAYSFAYIHKYIWDGASCKVTTKYVIDGLIYALLTGGTFGWLMAA